MKKRNLLLAALLLILVAPSFAAKVDTLLVNSPSMNKDVQVVVVTPDAALGKKAVACPVIYLLHGYGGNAKTWIGVKPDLHKDTFGAGGSTSGGVDIRPFPLNWDMSKQLGEFAYNKKVWDEHTVINQIDKIENGDLAIIIDCGEADFFLNVNKDLHNRLLARKINHDFITRPGGHNGKYWNNSIDYQILFFDKFFKK